MTFQYITNSINMFWFHEGSLMASARALIIAWIFSVSSQSRGGRGGRSQPGGGGGSAMLDLPRFKSLFGTGGGNMLLPDPSAGDPSPVALGTTVTEGATADGGGTNGLGTGVSPVSTSAAASET